MKIQKIAILGIVALLLLAPVIAGTQESNRYLIKSNNGYLKGLFGVQHEFKQGFTTDLTQGQLITLKKFGVEIEKVQMYAFTGLAVCGDGIIHPSEKCGEEGAKGCSDGFVCQECRCVKDKSEEPEPEPIRQVPDNQIPYGIAMVNGGSGGAGINVAVLDSGVARGHPDLDIKLCADASSHPKRVEEGTCADNIGHGTHVSGTIGANGGEDGLGIYGVAPESNLWMIKVGDGGIYADDLAEGIYYATDKGANIISMSLGGNESDQLVYDAVKYAYDNGVLIIAAAGNGGEYNDSVSYPARYPEVVSVSAIDSNKEIAFFSTTGAEVELTAPGVDVESTAGGMDYFVTRKWYSYHSGTSMATPHISGLAAKVWQGNAQDTRTYLHTIAEDLYTEGRDNLTGFGLPIAV